MDADGLLGLEAQSEGGPSGEDLVAGYGLAASDLLEFLDAAIEIAGADFGGVQLLDPATGRLRIVGQRGLPSWWVEYWNSASAGSGACHTALARKAPVIVEDVEASPIFAGSFALEVQRKAGVRAARSTPLITRSGRALGVFTTHYRRPYDPDARATRLLDLIARQAADLIERAEADRALRKSEELYRSVVEQAAEGIFIADPAGRFLEANPAGLQMLGYTLAELRALTIEDVRIASEISRLREQLAVVDSGGVTTDLWRLRRKDGSIFVGERVGRRLSDGRLLGVVRDVNTRLEAESALAESEARFRAFFDSAAVGMTQLDPNGRYVRVNDRLCEITGYSRAELEGGMSPLDLRLPEEREHDEKLIRRILERENEPAITLERQFRRKDGRAVWVRVTTARIEGAGVLRAATVIEDIDAQKRAELSAQEDQARLAALFEALPAGAALIDAQGQIVMSNPELRRYWPAPTIHALDPAQPLHWRATHPDGRPVEPKDFPAARALRGEPVVPGLEMRHFVEGEGEVWAQVASVPIRDESGHIAGAAVVVSDISEIKRAEAKLADLNARLSRRLAELEHETRLREQTQAALALSQRMEALGQLAGGVAHDFNTLLTVISGNLELAESRIADPGAKTSVRKALDAIELGAGLNRRLLAFARQRMASPERVVLNDRVGEIAELLRRTLGDSIVVEVRLEPTPWPTRADPGEIDSALVNIAVNARDAMPEGGRLTISTANVTLNAQQAEERNAKPGDYVTLCLADTGCGMNEDVLRKAVEPFFTTKETGKGTGLGLSSVYGFAHRSGGFLHIESEAGRGATVCIYLPRLTEGLSEPAQAAFEHECPPGQGELVLVVEDNAQVREVTMRRLEALGYAVMEASSGAEAIGLLRLDSQVRLVLSDVSMPDGVSGHELAKWIGEAKPGVKVLLASGDNEYDKIEGGLRVLLKPYSRADLARALRELLDG